MPLVTWTVNKAQRECVRGTNSSGNSSCLALEEVHAVKHVEVLLDERQTGGVQRHFVELEDGHGNPEQVAVDRRILPATKTKTVH